MAYGVTYLQAYRVAYGMKINGNQTGKINAIKAYGV